MTAVIFLSSISGLLVDILEKPQVIRNTLGPDSHLYKASIACKNGSITSECAKELKQVTVEDVYSVIQADPALSQKVLANHVPMSALGSLTQDKLKKETDQHVYVFLMNSLLPATNRYMRHHKLSPTKRMGVSSKQVEAIPAAMRSVVFCLDQIKYHVIVTVVVMLILLLIVGILCYYGGKRDGTRYAYTLLSSKLSSDKQSRAN